MITNLICSSGNAPKKAELEYDWLDDYWRGQGFEIYKIGLSSKLAGKMFSYIAVQIYKQFNSILFGIEIVKGENSKIFLNPG